MITTLQAIQPETITAEAIRSPQLPEFNSMIQHFEEFADVRPATFKSYKAWLKQFFEFLQESGTSTPTRADIIRWREYLLQEYKPTTAQNYLAAVKLFFKWTASEKLFDNIAENVKSVKVDDEFKKEYLNEEQAHDILSNMETNSIKGIRDKAIVALMITTGVRTIEVTRANIEDIKPRGRSTVLYLQGKGRDGKYEFVKIPSQVEKLIRTYLKARGAHDIKEPLFVSTSNNNQNSRVTTRTISKIAKQAMINAGYDSERLTAHSLRHTAATLSLLNGSTPEEVRQVLRHKDIKTTMIYSHALERDSNESEARVANAIF